MKKTLAVLLSFLCLFGGLCALWPTSSAVLAQAPAGSAAPAMTKERAEFERLLNEWKPMLQQMFDMRIEFHKYGTTPERQEQLLKEYNVLLKKSDTLSQQVIDQALLAFLKDERANADMEAFLLFALRYYMQMDMYEDAAKLSQHLLNQKMKNNDVIRMAAFSSLKSNDFETAAMLGETLLELGLITKFDYGRSDFGALEYWREAWKQELKFRERDRMKGDLPRVILQTTKGEIEIELFEDDAPNTVANFIYLVEKGFYTNLDFHRVIRGFMAQGGGYELLATETNLDGTLKKRGIGDPGYTIEDEVGPNSRKHFRGSVSMALAGPNTGGSQFFICFKPNAGLDRIHTVFGRVIRGMNVVVSFLPRDPIDPANPPEEETSENGTPWVYEVPGIEMPDKILSARVVRKRNHEYSPVIKAKKGQRPPFPKMPGLEDKPTDNLLDDNWDKMEFIRKHQP